MKKKLFISHASEDKEAFVRPLAEALRTDFEVWYDEYQLVMGMSLLEEISRGLTSCDYGIVVLSKSFFSKHWPQNELNGLFSLEENDRKVILPVWHGVEKSDVRKHSPILADRIAAKSTNGVDAVKDEIKRAVSYFERGKESVEASMSGLNKLKTALKQKAAEEYSEKILNSNEGLTKAGEFGQATIELLVKHVNNLIQEGASYIRVDGPKTQTSSYANNCITNCYASIWVDSFRLYAHYGNRVINSARDAIMEMKILEYYEDDSYDDKFTEIEEDKYSVFVAGDERCLWVPKYDKSPLTAEELVNIWMERFSDHITRKGQ